MSNCICNTVQFSTRHEKACATNRHHTSKHCVWAKTSVPWYESLPARASMTHHPRLTLFKAVEGNSTLAYWRDTLPVLAGGIRFPQLCRLIFQQIFENLTYWKGKSSELSICECHGRQKKKLTSAAPSRHAFSQDGSKSNLQWQAK